MNINDIRDLGRDWRTRNEEGSKWGDSWRGALFVILIVFGVEVARKGGKKIVDAVSTLCKDVYNYIKNRFRKNSANDEKVTNDATINETDELLQPIKA